MDKTKWVSFLERTKRRVKKRGEKKKKRKKKKNKRKGMETICVWKLGICMDFYDFVWILVGSISKV